MDEKLDVSQQQPGPIAAANPLPQEISRLKRRLESGSQTFTIQEDLLKGALYRLLLALPQLPESLRPDILKLLGEQGQGLLNYVIGLDPITGTARGAYEALTGYDAINGERLGPWERGIALAGLFTFGLVSDASRVLKDLSSSGKLFGLSNGESRVLRTLSEIASSSAEAGRNVIGKLADYARNLAPVTSGASHEQILADIGRALEKAHEEINIEKFYTAEELNALHLERSPSDMRPFGSYSYGVEGKVKSELIGYRFWGDATGRTDGAKKIGRWIVLHPQAEHLANMSPKEIQILYSLPVPPKYITGVDVPIGTKVIKSETSAIFGGSGGKEQYQIIEGPLPDWFTTTTKLKGER
jgi:hypothetical protein